MTSYDHRAGLPENQPTRICGLFLLPMAALWVTGSSKTRMLSHAPLEPLSSLLH